MFIVYSLNNCPHSHNAELLLNDKKLPRKIIPVTNETKNLVKKKLGNETFPHILYMDKKRGKNYDIVVVGGNSDLELLLTTVDNICELKRDHKLTDRMLKILITHCE
jgi:glutaredoxin